MLILMIGAYRFRRLIGFIELVLNPTERILQNILTNSLQSLIRAKNRIVILILPGKPGLAFGMTNVVRCSCLKHPHDLHKAALWPGCAGSMSANSMMPCI